MKSCTTCGVSKDFSLFSKNKNSCKECRSKKESERRMNNLEKYKQKDKEYYEKNKEVVLAKNKEYRQGKGEEIKENKKKYYQENKEEIKKYHEANKEKRNEKKRLKFKTDIDFRIKETLKSRIGDVLKNKKIHKTNILIGTSKQILKNWLYHQFDENQSWDNYGEYWHIDHVIPIDFFDLSIEREQLICFNWSNLRPLQKNENMEKSNKILKDEILNHIFILKSYDGYQANYENSWWRRVELRYGNNSEDKEDFESLLKWAIRSEDP
jgi:hypothetical protein